MTYPNIFDLMHLILVFILAGMAGACIGFFSYFLDYCFWPQSIFKGYLPMLAKYFLRKRADFPAIKAMDAQSIVDLASDIPWFKLLGGCSVCFNVWLTFVSFGLLYAFVPFVPLWAYIPYLGLSSFTIRKLVGAD